MIRVSIIAILFSAIFPLKLWCQEPIYSIRLYYHPLPDLSSDSIILTYGSNARTFTLSRIGYKDTYNENKKKYYKKIVRNKKSKHILTDESLPQAFQWVFQHLQDSIFTININYDSLKLIEYEDFYLTEALNFIEKNYSQSKSTNININKFCALEFLTGGAIDGCPFSVTVTKLSQQHKETFTIEGNFDGPVDYHYSREFFLLNSLFSKLSFIPTGYEETQNYFIKKKNLYDIIVGYWWCQNK